MKIDLFKKFVAVMVMCGVMAVGLGAVSLRAAVRLANIFGDHAVLQQHMPVVVWGWANPNEKITVSFAGQSVTAQSDSTGKWRLKLAAMPADAKGRDMVVQGSNRLIIHDVLVGEVWLCSGQSNMEYPVRGFKRGSTPKKEITSAHYPLIRVINAAQLKALQPQKALYGSHVRWIICSPHTVPRFSAVGYFFGRDLFNKLHVPIGLITSDVGGTLIQPWTPICGYENSPQLLPEYQKEMAQWKKRNLQNVSQRYIPYKHPAVLFNGMIAPLIPYSIRGVIWYQGETNVGDPMYYDRLKALVTSWRKLWQEGDIPFYIVQIAPFDYRGNRRETAEPLLWQAEENVVRTVPNTGIAGTMDLGMLHNVHYYDKWDVGYRLSLWALAETYGVKGLVYSGPMYKSMRINGNKAIIQFDHTGTGLKSRNGKVLTWFQIAGPDGHFVPAQATIHGDTLVVQADSVTAPKAVRFAWSDLAQPNLENSAGLPALPFTTERMSDEK